MVRESEFGFIPKVADKKPGPRVPKLVWGDAWLSHGW